MALPTTDAYYHIFSAVAGDGTPESMFCTDVVGSGKSDYSKVQVYTPHYGQNQVVWVGYKSGNVYYLWDDNSAKWFSSWTSKAADGENVCIWHDRAGNYAKWYFQEVGTATINGSTYPTYYIRALGSSSGRVVTAPAGSTGLITIRPIGYPDGAKGRKATTPSPRQLWMLIPTTEGANSYTVPSSGGAATSKTSSTATTVIAGSGSLYPSWAGDKTVNQIRYRVRTRPTNDSMGAWSHWKCINNGSAYNIGWGSPPTLNVTSTKSGNRRVSNTAITMENLGTAYDRADYWIQVREYDSGKKWHGRRHGFTVTQVKQPTVDTVTCTWDPKGILVSWAMTNVRDGSTVTVESTGSPLMFSKRTKANATADDSLLVPQSALRQAARPGLTVRVKVSVKTPEGATASRSGSVSVTTEDAAGTMTLDASVSGTIATITASQPDASAWLVVPRGHGDRLVELAGSSPWKVAPPLGVPWRIYAAYASGGTYYEGEQELPAIDAGRPAIRVTSQDLAHELAIRCGTATPPSLKFGYERDVEEARTFGRERPAYSHSGITESSVTVDGTVPDEDLGEVDWFAHDSHVYLRDSEGGWWQCGVSSITLERSQREWHDVSVALKEEVW